MAHSVFHPSSPLPGLDRRPYPSLSSPFLTPVPSLSSPFISAQQKHITCIHQISIFSPGTAILKNPLLHGLTLNSWPLQRKAFSPNFQQRRQCLSASSFGGGYGAGGGERGGGGGGGNGHGYGKDDGEHDEEHASDKVWRFGLFPLLSEGWKERVCADPQFPFKILTEEIIGVAASVFGDMSCRPGFGLGELDFVFSNLIVCAIVNFALMYVLAPTSATAAGGGSLPGMFSCCPPGHMWEMGAYSLAQRMGTFVYKGALFATVGFGAGLVGTALSTMILNVRRQVDPSFSLQNPPPTLLNACTWALQLGVSSNSRYQLLNGLEFGLEGVMNPSLFKGLVFVIRSLNNVVGGMSFMMMARLTGSQDRPKQMLEMQT
ncbi:hypothetical protein L7F22_020610 [Adiantum nelumboides]|nr:hypothetical protein [Adiantum nelumboides]